MSFLLGTWSWKEGRQPSAPPRLQATAYAEAEPGEVNRKHRCLSSTPRKQQKHGASRAHILPPNDCRYSKDCSFPKGSRTSPHRSWEASLPSGGHGRDDKHKQGCYCLRYRSERQVTSRKKVSTCSTPGQGVCVTTAGLEKPQPASQAKNKTTHGQLLQTYGCPCRRQLRQKGLVRETRCFTSACLLPHSSSCSGTLADKGDFKWSPQTDCAPAIP